MCGDGQTGGWASGNPGLKLSDIIPGGCSLTGDSISSSGSRSMRSGLEGSPSSGSGRSFLEERDRLALEFDMDVPSGMASAKSLLELFRGRGRTFGLSTRRSGR